MCSIANELATITIYHKGSNGVDNNFVGRPTNRFLGSNNFFLQMKIAKPSWTWKSGLKSKGRMKRSTYRSPRSSGAPAETAKPCAGHWRPTGFRHVKPNTFEPPSLTLTLPSSPRRVHRSTSTSPMSSPRYSRSANLLFKFHLSSFFHTKLVKY